jgi:hypothetical protein
MNGSTEDPAPQEKAFDPSEPRDPAGQWDAGTGGGHGPAEDRKHTAANDAKHPLGEGTLNSLRVALNHAGMPKNDVLALVQKMRDNFHHDGQINIPKEADKFLSTEDRAKLGQEIRAEAEKRGWDATSGAWNPKKSVELEPGDKVDFAKGYADGTTGREKAETPTEEYLRGYEDGKKERASVEDQEIAKFNDIISSLKTKT